ncbi:unnamed protein product [Calypogeia fissa]
MADPMEVVPPSKSLNVDMLSTQNLLEMDEEDLYTRMKFLQRQLEFVDIQEEYVKDEQKNLKWELLRVQVEVKRIQSVPLVIGQFIEMADQNNGIVGSMTGLNYYVRILSTINRELLKSSSSMALHRHSNALVDVLPPEADSSISLLTQSEKPNVLYMAFHWLAQTRVEYIETTPSVSRLAHARIISFMAVLLTMDCLLFNQSFSHLLKTREASVSLFFAFEYIILATATVATFVKYSLYLGDMIMDGQWDNKAIYVFYLELVRDLFICLFIFSSFWSYSGSKAYHYT